MSKELVYVGDIVPSKSIIGMLNGTEMFCIANPYFQVDNIKRPDLKQFLEQSSSSKYGTFLSKVEIHVKTMPTRPFTSRFAIAWANARGAKKQYYIKRLYELDTISTKEKLKFLIGPNGGPSETDKKLCALDYQLTFVMDILLLAKILDINLSTYADLTDNSQFFAKFCLEMMNSINKHLDKDSQLTKDDLKVKKSYIDSFINTPIFMSRDKKYFAIEQLGKPKTTITSIWKLFYEIYSNQDLASKFPKWKNIISANSAAMPTFRFVDYLNPKTNNHESRFDCRITIVQRLPDDNPNHNAKLPKFLFTQRCTGPNKFEPITPNNLPLLWGSTGDNPQLTGGVVQTGCIFLVPQLDFKYYATGNPTIDWRAEQLALKKESAAGSSGYDDAAAFMDDENDDNGGDQSAEQFNDNGEVPI